MAWTARCGCHADPHTTNDVSQYIHLQFGMLTSRCGMCFFCRFESPSLTGTTRTRAYRMLQCVAGCPICTAIALFVVVCHSGWKRSLRCPVSRPSRSIAALKCDMVPAQVLLATMEFDVLAAGDTGFTGVVIEASHVEDTGTEADNVPIVAGRVDTCVAPAGGAARRLQTSALLPAGAAAARQPSAGPGHLSQPRRRLQQGIKDIDCGSCTLERHNSLVGDLNFDCRVRAPW